MKNVGILYNPLKEKALKLAHKLTEFLNSSGVSCWLCSAWDNQKSEQLLGTTDLVLTIGGDGTILRAAQSIAPQAIPITGINLGRLGFLTELAVGEAIEKLPELLSGGGWIDERAMLEVEVHNNKQKNNNFFVVNDAVVARGEIARIINVDIAINGQPLATYASDGVIVATATGSTGYALAAGGPILPPQSPQFVLTPIMPHLSLPYPLVLSPDASIELRMGDYHKAVLSIDGHISLPLSGGSSITIKHSQAKTRFLRINTETSFYGTLEQKLKG